MTKGPLLPLHKWKNKPYGDKFWQTFSEAKINHGLLQRSAEVLHLLLSTLLIALPLLQAENYHTGLASNFQNTFVYIWSQCRKMVQLLL